MRKEVLQSFDGLVAIFADAELLLATYPKDSNIWDASVGLTITVLDAIEQAIGFFIRNTSQSIPTSSTGARQLIAMDRVCSRQRLKGHRQRKLL